MGKILWHVTMSLDGFIAGPGDAMDWVFEYPEPNETADEVIETTGALVVGRRTYEVEDRQRGGFYGGAWTVGATDRPPFSGGQAGVTTQQELEATARAIIDSNRYMVLGTADGDGLPWVSPVWYATDDYRVFFWVSSPDARHSRNLATRPEVSIVIFDSHVPGGWQSVYMSRRRRGDGRRCRARDRGLLPALGSAGNARVDTGGRSAAGTPSSLSRGHVGAVRARSPGPADTDQGAWTLTA